jgi:CBS domain-containing protein
MEVHYVAKLMVNVGIRMAPVEEKGEYIGIVSLSDLILDNLLF